MDTGYYFETLNGDSDIPLEFQLEIQLDMSVVADFTGSLDTHGDGASYRTNITRATLLAEIPIQEEEDAVATATSSGSRESFPIRKLPTDDTKTWPVTPVVSITNQNSSLGGSPSARLEVSPD